MERERLGSRLGFILLSAGCAIGIGNVWKFPYMVGQYGGGAFVLIYLFFLVILGVPVLTMEFALGRASQKSPVRLYQKLEKPGSKWHIHGYAAFLGNVILMMFYTVVSGWMLRYFVAMASGELMGAQPAEVESYFGNMLGEPKPMVIYTLIVIVIGFAVCSLGLQNGLERITKVMMIALLVIMVILAVNSIFMEGGSEGLAFYLLPDFGRIVDIGVGEVVAGAMNQAFFTLSLGIGAMAIFGSYIEKKHTLMGEAVNVCILDTFVAFTSGLIIFPACFAYGVEANSGPSLIFITLPNIFANIPMGRVVGSLFFIFMSFASLSTVFAVFENIMACLIDMLGWTRKKTCLVAAPIMFLLSLPCVFGFNIWSAIQPLGAGSSIMDLEDFLVSNILLPLGSLIFVIFCVSRYGWGWDKFMKEANEGKGIKVASWMRGYITYILPLIVLVILIMGLV